MSWRIHCLAAKWRHDSVPRDKFDCDNELSAVPIPSTPHSSTHPTPLLLLLSVLAIQAKKKRKNPKGRKGKGGDGDAAAAAGNVAGGGGMTSSRSGDVGPNASSGRQFR